jgi:heptosyltransferase-2
MADRLEELVLTIGQLAPTCRILVARLDALGDCVLSSAFFAALRQRFPKAHLTGAFSVLAAQLFEHCPLFDRILAIPPGPTSAWRTLIGAPYDLAICPRWDVDYWSTRQLAMLSQAPVRVGFERGPYHYDQPNDGWAGAYFTDLVRTRSDLHEVLKGLDMLKYLGMDGPMPDPRLWIPEASTRWAGEFVERHRLGRFAVLAVSAASKNRIWAAPNFLPVIDALSAAADWHFVVVGAQDAAESGAWLQRMRPEAVVCATGAVPLLSTAALIARSDIYIGMDTGLMHLAAASKVPVVEISCHPVSGGVDHPNSPRRFGPYATRHRILQPLQPLTPCLDGCNILDSPHCITQIRASQVLDAARELLEE